MEQKKLSDVHVEQIRGIVRGINEVKTQIADFELKKLESAGRVQQMSMELNNLVGQFPALYDVPGNSQVDIDRGVILFEPQQPNPSANPEGPGPLGGRRIHPADPGDNKE